MGMSNIVIGEMKGGIPAGAPPGEAKRQHDEWMKKFDGIDEEINRDIILEKLDKMYKFHGRDTEYKDGWSRTIDAPQPLKEFEECFEENDMIPQLIRALVNEYQKNRCVTGSVLVSCESCGETKRMALESCAQCSCPNLKDVMRELSLAAADVYLYINPQDPPQAKAWNRYLDAWSALQTEL